LFIFVLFLLLFEVACVRLTDSPAVPDFYGEKISSVAGYRQWLRDQRAFNRKKTGAFV